jgi:hypothetical protein
LACLAIGAEAAVVSAQETPPPGETQRLEGEAILALADAALEGQRVPGDFGILWQNEFLKAQRGTFVPFTITIESARFTRPSVLVYVRAVRLGQERLARGRGETGKTREGEGPSAGFPVDAIFPADLQVEPGQRARVSRGFTLPAGSYNVFVVVRERVDPMVGRIPPKAAVLRQPLEVPDLQAPGLTTSSLILADRLETLGGPIGPDELAERPYVIGQNEITPAADRRFRRNEELIVVFLIYHPFVTSERKFDLQVEYHFFRRGVGPAGPSGGGPAGTHPPAQDGERYFNHTDPQRFNPAVLGAEFNPAAGHPLLAGQGVPLSGFDEGDYRLAVRITDLLAGTSIQRDVHFTVGS